MAIFGIEESTFKDAIETALNNQNVQVKDGTLNVHLAGNNVHVSAVVSKNDVARRKDLSLNSFLNDISDNTGGTCWFEYSEPTVGNAVSDGFVEGSFTLIANRK